MGHQDRLCVIRKFKSGDEGVIQKIITDATMATVMDFFWAAVLSEIFPQVAVACIGVCFVMFSIPFKICLFSVPVAFIIIYVVIWCAHMFKAMELHSDLNNIRNTYMSDPDCGFWVAEVYDVAEATELDRFMNKQKKVEYQFMTEELFKKKEPDVKNLKCRIVGTVAITKSMQNPNNAWLRRMAVRKEYQRRGIAGNLLEEVINFCTERDYNGIELVTTECHHKARELYYKRGFEAEHTYFKSYFNVRQPMYQFFMNLKKVKDAASSQEESEDEQTQLEDIKLQ